MTVFLATITNNGEIDLGSDINKSRWHDFALKNVGATIRIDKPDKKRTLPQNRFYWFYLSVIAKETGNNEEDLHAFFRQRLLPRRHITIKGRKGNHEIEDYKSTTKLTKLEFGDFLDRICAMTEVPIPSPELAGYFHS